MAGDEAQAQAELQNVQQQLNEAESNELQPDFKGGIDPEDASATVHVTGGTADTIYKAGKTFEELGLSKTLLDGVYGMNFVQPSKIQAQALPIILQRDAQGKLLRPNLIAQAHHGSGKTATYTLAMLSMIDETLNYPQALCVCPTRELATQVFNVATQLARFTSIKPFLAVHGAQRDQPISEHLVVGTAGTLLGEMRYKQFDPRKIRILVLDEADQMLNSDGFISDSLKIRKEVNKLVQVLLFSATYPAKVRDFADKFAPQAIKIIIKREKELTLKNIKQFYIDCGSQDEKFQYLQLIFSLTDVGSVIIFTRTVATAKQLKNDLVRSGFGVSLLHGKDMDPHERDTVMNDFRSGKTNVLITTNVLARGIDVQAVSLVINYELPLDKFKRADPEVYIHRIGRSGRFGRKGVAINFLDDSYSREAMRFLEEHFESPNEQITVANMEQKVREFFQ